VAVGGSVDTVRDETPDVWSSGLKTRRYVPQQLRAETRRYVPRQLRAETRRYVLQQLRA
jgi:hypothetical protein